MNSANYTLSDSPSYDLHLSAYAIKPETIKKLEEAGFTRDQFANNRYCDTTAYHGSFHAWIGDNKLWYEIASLLNEDETFNGGLEEEIKLPYFRKEFVREANPIPLMAPRLPLSTENTLNLLKEVFPTKVAVPCPAGRNKACDIHINIDCGLCGINIQEAFDGLKIVSFDRPTDNKAGFNRIYTLTFEDLAEGVHVFDTVTAVIGALNDISKNSFIFGFVGKIKLEITTRIYRKPLDGILLPLILKG